MLERCLNLCLQLDEPIVTVSQQKMKANNGEDLK